MANCGSTDHFSQWSFTALLMTLDLEKIALRFDPRFLQPWKHRMAIYRALQRFHQAGEDVSNVVRPIVDALEDDGLRDHTLRGSGDVGLCELVILLPRAECVLRCTKYLTHRRKTRRHSARRALLRIEAKEASGIMLKTALDTADATLASAALRLGAEVRNIDEVLGLIGDGASASRILEQHVTLNDISNYARDYPSAVLRFIGRTKNAGLGRLAVRMLEDLIAAPFAYTYFRGDDADDLIGLGFWTLGRLGLREDIIRLEQHDQGLRAKHDPLSSGKDAR